MPYMSIGGILNLTLAEHENKFNRNFMFRSVRLGDGFGLEDFTALRLMYKTCKGANRLPYIAHYVEGYLPKSDRIVIFFNELGELCIGMWGMWTGLSPYARSFSDGFFFKSLAGDLLDVVSTHEIKDPAIRKRLKKLYERLCVNPYPSGKTPPKWMKDAIKRNVENARSVIELMSFSKNETHKIWDLVKDQCSYEPGVVSEQDWPIVKGMLWPTVDKAIPYMLDNFECSDLEDILPVLFSVKHWLMHKDGIVFPVPSLMREVFITAASQDAKFKPLIGDYSEVKPFRLKEFTIEEAKSKVMEDILS